MALDTLKGIKEINGFPVHRVVWKQPKGHFIEINDEDNAVTFKLQEQPINEVGINGCQVDELVATAKVILEGLNKNLPCRENSIAITKLDEAMHWLSHRRNDREKRKVEGTSNA